MDNLVEDHGAIFDNPRPTCKDIDAFTQIRTPKLGNLGLAGLNIGPWIPDDYSCSRICNNYLKDVKHNPNNRTSIGGRGHIGAGYRLDLSTRTNIGLPVPVRRGQHDQVPFPKAKGRTRKRVETNCMGSSYGQRAMRNPP